MVDFSGLEPSPGCAPFGEELRKYSAQRCTTVPEIVSLSGLGVIVDCKDSYLQEWVLQLNNTPHTNGYTIKVEQLGPRLKPEDIYALAHKNVSEREPLDRLNRGDKSTVTYTHRPSLHKTAVNAVNADATANPTTTEPIDTSVNAVGHPKPAAKKTADPGLNCHLPIILFWFHVPNIENTVNKRIWTTVLIGVSPTTSFGRVNLILHAMAPIGRFGVSLSVVNLRAVVAIRVVGALRAAVAIRVAVAVRWVEGERERGTGADVGRSAQRSPL